ncbi:helix-turn-helix domain-containing protein [Nocardia sp. NBC_01329]|uniref:helix-turn-helix domain-containing protein n=1 Tax=Nocardia sp. NBC_01329 TaxID=2903594 RepID=UPI002E10E742|nr:helix-turn-helix domain-containing protein [Nocardia sp. NBC_01329]
MPSKADLSGTTLPRRQLGRALRDARHAHGATLDQVARDTEFSRATLSRIELGQYERIKVREVEYLCRYYGLSSEKMSYLKAVAAQSSTTVWWQGYRHVLGGGFTTYLELESYATELQVFQPLIVPGLLQTGDYARQIFAKYSPGESEDSIEGKVELRMRRYARLTRRHLRIRVEFVIHESVLHAVVGSARVMAAQCRHIADISARDNIEVRVLPFSAGIPTGGVMTPFIVLGFLDGEPSAVYAEAALGSTTFDDAEDVLRYRSLYDLIRAATIDETASRDRIRKIARRYEQ